MHESTSVLPISRSGACRALLVVDPMQLPPISAEANQAPIAKSAAASTTSVPSQTDTLAQKTMVRFVATVIIVTIAVRNVTIATTPTRFAVRAVGQTWGSLHTTAETI